MKFPDAMRLSRTDLVKLQEADPDFRMIFLSAVGKQRKGRIQLTQEQLRKKLERQFKRYPNCVFPEDVSKMLRLGINTVYHMLMYTLPSGAFSSATQHQRVQWANKLPVKEFQLWLEDEWSAAPDAMTKRKMAQLTGYSDSSFQD